MSAERLTKAAVVMLVVLRLVTGWHFFSEGQKKLEPGFTSAWFLRGAKGPLAPAFKSFVTGPHQATYYLDAPLELGAVSADEAAEAQNQWLERIEADWDKGLERFSRLGASDEFQQRAASEKDAAVEELSKYLKNESAAIADLRHEAWRLEQLKKKATSDPAPFFGERVAEKEAEVWGGMQPWFAAVRSAEESFIDRVVAAAAETEGAPSESRIRSALAERNWLSWLDVVVTTVVLGSGVLLFLGLFTRLAAVLAAGFLMSVIASQPPWVVGADTTYFFYQLVEVVALLLIAVVGAGKWCGLDGVYLAGCQRFDQSPNQSSSQGA